MNGAGGNSTRLMFDDDDDYNNSTPLSTTMYALLTLFILLTLFKIVYERWMTPLANIPGHPLHSITSIPMRYHMLRGQLPSHLLGLHQKYGSIVRISPQRISVADPEMIKHVLGSHVFGKTPSYDMPQVLEPNCFSTRVPELSVERRRQVGPGFSHGHLAKMESKIVECGVLNVRRKLDALMSVKDSTVVQYSGWFSLIALDTIGELGFGKKFGALLADGHELVAILVRIRIFNYITMALPWFKQLPRVLGKRLRTLTTLMDFASEAINVRRKEEQGGEPRQGGLDLLQIMLDVGRAEGDKRAIISDGQMVSETILHLIAGVDTTSAGLTWTLALLLHNPVVMEKLVTDIRRNFALDSVVSYEECRLKVPYLSAVISESLRVMSPAPGILPRLAPPGGVRLDGYVVPKGTWICCSVGSLHMNPLVFPEPDAFKPERFLASGGGQGNMLAFSTGVRACLGRNLALVEMHVVLANLLKDYDLALPHGVQPLGGIPDIPRKSLMTMNPVNPEKDCLVVISRRKLE
ncbi:hypothetical protein LPJ66_009443 [Kickxella alabastrina]|uniref:Uncharacterized protein n=1 Tax=Kickxella alabastrina TaxID=61397 RepID=A0ACC1I3U0_9FUNG|nr:hypothetical protein LPJ66_009443 [Kickxella alabastrina]